MVYPKCLTVKQIGQVVKMMKELSDLPRMWTANNSKPNYSLDKQSMNSLVAYILAMYYETEENRKVDLKKLVKCANFRAFKKTAFTNDSPTHILDNICNIAAIRDTKFVDEKVKEELKKQFGDEYRKFACEGIDGSYEMELTRAASKLATYIELTMIKNCFDDSMLYWEKVVEVKVALSEFFEKFPIIKDIVSCNPNDTENLEKKVDGKTVVTGEKLYKLFRDIYKLKNQIRWVKALKSVNCSVLSHLFETATYAYYMALEKYWGEELAAKLFFCGIFHDVAEVWTTDISSVVKDEFGIRAATELYEVEMLKKYLYSNFSEAMIAKLKEVMMEEGENAKYKKFLKSADYFAADMECLRNLIAGSREIYYYNVIVNGHKDISSGKVEITPNFKRFRAKVYRYAVWLKLRGEFFKFV